MPRQKSERITPLELEIVKVLWDAGPANVQTVQRLLERQLAYTTVQTMLNVLHRKGKVSRELNDKAYFYQATVSRREVLGNAFGELIDGMFGGSAESLVMGLLETRHLTPEKLARISDVLKEAKPHDPKS
jgi:predicted transcriptional regulator